MFVNVSVIQIKLLVVSKRKGRGPLAATFADARNKNTLCFNK